MSTASPIFSQLVTGARVGRGPLFGLSGSVAPGGHRGVDLAVMVGTPVRAIAEGTVVFAGNRADYGNVVVVKHTLGDGREVFTLAGHLAQLPSVVVGMTVTAGQQLGLSGNTGRSTGPHVHFEIVERLSGQANPVDQLGNLSGYFKYSVLDPKVNPYGLLNWNPTQIERWELTSQERIDQLKLSAGEFEAYKRRLATIESGSGLAAFLATNQDDAAINYSTNTGNGKYGAYQIGVDALKDAGMLDSNGAWTSAAKTMGVNSFADFVASAQAQDAALQALTNKNIQFLVGKDYDLGIGLNLAGKTITTDGLLLAAHHRRASAGEFLDSGGTSDPAQGSNPPISSYFSAGSITIPVPPGSEANPVVGYWQEAPVYTELGVPLTFGPMVWIGPNDVLPTAPAGATLPPAPSLNHNSAGATYLSRDGASATLANGQVINAGVGGRLLLEADGGVSVQRRAVGFDESAGQIFDVVAYARTGQIRSVSQIQVVKDAAHPNDPALNTVVKQGEARDIDYTNLDGSISIVTATFQVGRGWIAPATGELVQSMDAWRASTAMSPDARAYADGMYKALIQMLNDATGATGPGQQFDPILTGIQLAALSDGVAFDTDLIVNFGSGKYLTAEVDANDASLKTFSGTTVTSSAIFHAFDDGGSLFTTNYLSGAITTIATAPDNTSQQLDTPAPNSGQDPNTLAITLRDAAGAITATGSRTVNPIDGSYEEALLGSATPGQPNGTLSARSVSATGEVSPKLDKAALDNLNQNAQYEAAINVGLTLAEAVHKAKSDTIKTVAFCGYSTEDRGRKSQVKRAHSRILRAPKPNRSGLRVGRSIPPISMQARMSAQVSVTSNLAFLSDGVALQSDGWWGLRSKSIAIETISGYAHFAHAVEPISILNGME